MAAYVEYALLQKQHTDSVTALAFSSCGTYLASCSYDLSVCIWSVSKAQLMYRVVFDHPVTVLQWHPTTKDTLLAGCEGGVLYWMNKFTMAGPTVSEIRLGVRGVIFCLDIDPVSKSVAVGIGSEVHIIQDALQLKHTTMARLPEPSFEHVRTSRNKDERIRSCSVHFYDDGNKLIVSYINHGVVGWNLAERTPIWHIKSPNLPARVGSSAIYREHNMLAVNTIREGPYLFKIGEVESIRKWAYNTPGPDRNSSYVLPVRFLHQGQAVASGTSTGNLCIWQARSDDLYQVLPHGADLIQAIATHHDQIRSHSYIAAASSRKGPETYIKIWRANIQLHPDELDIWWGGIIVSWFSMDWGDYGRVTLLLAYALISVWCLLAFAKMLWYHIPWTWSLDVFLTLFQWAIVKLADILGMLWVVCLNVRYWLTGVWQAMLEVLRLKVLEFLHGAGPQDVYHHRPPTDF